VRPVAARTLVFASKNSPSVCWAEIPKRAADHLIRYFDPISPNEKVVGFEGPPPPKRVGMVEWDSLEKAEAFYKSKAWTDLTPDREKAVKTNYDRLPPLVQLGCALQRPGH